MENLGIYLQREGYLTEAALQEFKRIAADAGRSLAATILSHSNHNPVKLYQKISEYKNLEFADLQKNPCNLMLVDESEREEYLKMDALPWKIQGDITIIATSEVTEELLNWAEQKYQGKYKFALTTPFDISQSINNLFKAQNDYDAREKLYAMNPLCSAKHKVGAADAICLISLTSAFILLAYFFPMQAMATAFAVTSVFYAFTMLFKLLLFVVGYFEGRNVEKTEEAVGIKNKDLPVYTILVPLYREEKVLAKLVESLLSLDYPKTKLDIKLIVEDDDEATISAIKTIRPPRNFEIIRVPYSLPRTKPKACNYALRFAKGEFVTIYDAEDRPEPLQLKKVLHKFYSGDKKLACVQARLNYFNHSNNLLTRMFAMEYSVLFDFMLFGLKKTNMPIPLGGTSNHFRTETLRKLYAWDPYNVTEDADLGIRIYQSGMRCDVVWSRTEEEAPVSVWAWIKQRSRWIKGHMQTYLVHMRKPLELYRKTGAAGFMGVQFFLGAPTLIFLISPLMWGAWVMFMFGIFRIKDEPAIWFSEMLEVSMAALICGIAMQVVFALAAIIRNKWWKMLPYSALFPFYWVLHSVASFRALWQLFTKPFYWEKTTHGVSAG